MLHLASLTAGLTFDAWVHAHGKVYATEAARLHAASNFAANERRIAAHNADAHTWQMGHTQFSDLSDAEFASRVHRPGMARGGSPLSAASAAAAPAQPPVDWTTKGAVTPVKDQGHCGACWSFATTANIEGAYAIASGTLLELSNQDVLSCMSSGSPIAGHGFTCGCSGGDPYGVFTWVKDHGIELWSKTPYTNVTANCDGMNDPSPANCDCGETGLPPCPAHPKCPDECAATTRAPVVGVTGYTQLPAGGDAENTTLLASVAAGPVTALVDCEAPLFKNYKSGIIDGPCDGIHNHVVLIVGFGEEGGVPYWKVKNSFGQQWGEEGYVRIARGKGLCGIGGEQYVPTGAHKWSGEGAVTVESA